MMTIKEWYPEYNFIQRLMVWLKYKLDPYRKKMLIDCYMYYKFDSLDKASKHEILLDHEIPFYEKKFNSDSARPVFNNKKLFYKTFQTYMKRAIIFLDEVSFEEFHDFILKNGNVVVKPNNLFGGQGFRIINSDEIKDLSSLRKEFELMHELGYVCEEYLINEESYRRIYDKSLNTVRVNTLISKCGQVIIIGVVNQFGSSGSITDNDEEKGLWSAADIDTGIIKWAEKDDETAVYYDIHPDTREAIIGFENKEYNRIKELSIELAKVVPEARLIGWDIAVTDKGIELIEGNVTPELGVLQAMTGKGFRTLFEEEIM